MADNLAVIVPVYNEEATVAEVIGRLRDQPVVSQIVIVDDGSSDGTISQLDPWGDDPVVTIIRHQRNCGKGRAIRTGLGQVSREFVLVQDADLEYDPADIPRLWAMADAGEADVIYGSRYLANGGLQRGRFLLQSGVRLLNLTSRWLYGLRLTDEATCYKLFRTSDLRAMHLQCERFEFCPEVTAKSARMGLRIRELPVSYAPRGAADGKKLQLSDGLAAIGVLLRWRFVRFEADRRQSAQKPTRSVLGKRNGLLFCTVAAVIAVCLLLMRPTPRSAVGVELSTPFRLRESWPDVDVGISPAEASRLSSAVWPKRGESSGQVAHALHAFHHSKFPTAVPEDSSDYPTCDEMLSLFLRSDVAGEWYEGQSLLLRTRHGIRYSMPLRYTAVSQTHSDQTLALLAELGVPLDQTVDVPGPETTISAMLSDCEARYDFRHEYEWSTLALALYRPTRTRWRNRFGEEFTFDAAVRRMCRERLFGRSCSGSHVLMAVAALVQVDDRYGILSDETRRRCLAHMQCCLRAAINAQEASGAIPLNWLDDLQRDADFQFLTGLEPLTDRDREAFRMGRRLLCTSHLLEWMAMVPPELAPPAAVFERGLSFISGRLSGVTPEAVRHAYCEYSHGIGLMLRTGKAEQRKLSVNSVCPLRAATM